MSDEIARELADWMPNQGDRLFVATDTGAQNQQLAGTTAGWQADGSRWALRRNGFC